MNHNPLPVYRQFQDTLPEFEQCLNALDFPITDLIIPERLGADHLYDLCVEFVNRYDAQMGTHAPIDHPDDGQSSVEVQIDDPINEQPFRTIKVLRSTSNHPDLI